MVTLLAAPRFARQCLIRFGMMTFERRDPQFTGDLHVGHGHDDLAFGAARFQLGDRLGDAFEGAVADRLEFARVHKARQFRQVRSTSFLKLAASLSGFQSQL